jgi:lysozyme
MLDELRKMLIKNEGLVCNLYKCTADKLTIGVGRNIEVNGISEDEALYLLNNDIKRVTNNLDKMWPIWRTFPKRAQYVCVDMSFQMGITGFMNFRKTRALMEMGCWLEASEEILRSKYATQTPNRSAYNSRQLALSNTNEQDKGTKPK